MKTFLIIAVTTMVVVAEPPISKSYLPPPPGGRAGYPQGSSIDPSLQTGAAPQIIAARSFDQSAGNAFARSGSHDQTTARFNGIRHGYENSGPVGRNAIEDTIEPANYNFGYMVNAVLEGTEFGHREERQEETAEGEYHVLLPDGRRQTVSYKADERGFKPQISYEETEDVSAGYDGNANNHGSHENSVLGVRNQHDNGFGNHDNGFNGGHGNHGNARSGY